MPAGDTPAGRSSPLEIPKPNVEDLDASVAGPITAAHFGNRRFDRPQSRDSLVDGLDVPPKVINASQFAFVVHIDGRSAANALNRDAVEHPAADNSRADNSLLVIFAVLLTACDMQPLNPEKLDGRFNGKRVSPEPVEG